jgi:hypothetical protein
MYTYCIYLYFLICIYFNIKKYTYINYTCIVKFVYVYTEFNTCILKNGKK